MLPPRLRRLLPRAALVPLLGAVALTACAHVRERIVDRVDEVQVRDVALVVRYATVDATEAVRVQRALQAAVPVAERWGPLPREVTVTIHPTHASLEEAARRPGVWWLRAWSRRASIDLQSPRTWTSGAATQAHLTQLLAHELTHCAMFEAIGSERSGELGIPAWFREGMATSNAGEHFATSRRDAVGSLTTNAAFQGDGAPLAYAAANDAFVALERRFGRAPIRELLARVRRGSGFAQAFHDALGISVGAFEADLARSLPGSPTAG